MLVTPKDPLEIKSHRSLFRVLLIEDEMTSVTTTTQIKNQDAKKIQGKVRQIIAINARKGGWGR